MAIDFSLSPEQQAIQETAHNLVKRLAPRREEFKRKIFVEKKFPEEIWQGLAEAGFMGALIPEEYGGSGLGLLPLTMATETLGGEGFASALLVVTAMDTACLVRCGSEAQKKKLLPLIAEGKMKLSFALTEADAGSNTFRIKTLARRSPGGNSYLVNGEKTFITGADASDLMLLVTRTTTAEECKAQGLPKAYGLSLMLVDPKARGISMTPLKTRGIEGFTQFTVHFDDVEVPLENLVGEENAGTMVLFNSLNPERLMAGAISCGMAAYLIKRSVDYARERVVFGDRPIGSYQAISHPLAQLHIEVEATRHLLYRAAWGFDAGQDAQEVGFYANAAKYKAAEVAIAAADRAIQTHGGSGFDEDVGIIYYWEAARLLRTAPVTAEMILNYVAEHRLGLPRSY